MHGPINIKFKSSYKLLILKTFLTLNVISFSSSRHVKYAFSCSRKESIRTTFRHALLGSFLHCVCAGCPISNTSSSPGQITHTIGIIIPATRITILSDDIYLAYLHKPSYLVHMLISELIHHFIFKFCYHKSFDCVIGVHLCTPKSHIS